MNRDPIACFEKLLVAERTMTMESVVEMWQAISEDIEKAILFGMESPFPDPEDALDGLFVKP